MVFDDLQRTVCYNAVCFAPIFDEVTVSRRELLSLLVGNFRATCGAGPEDCERSVYHQPRILGEECTS